MVPVNLSILSYGAVCYYRHSGSKQHLQCKMAAPISQILWLHFCTEGGSGHTLFLSFTVYNVIPHHLWLIHWPLDYQLTNNIRQTSQISPYNSKYKWTMKHLRELKYLIMN